MAQYRWFESQVPKKQSWFQQAKPTVSASNIKTATKAATTAPVTRGVATATEATQPGIYAKECNAGDTRCINGRWNKCVNGRWAATNSPCYASQTKASITSPTAITPPPSSTSVAGGCTNPPGGVGSTYCKSGIEWKCQQDYDQARWHRTGNPCTAGCTSDAECAPNEKCVNGTCQAQAAGNECVGTQSQCINGVWNMCVNGYLKPTSAPCGGGTTPPPSGQECSAGQTKCVDGKWNMCANGHWTPTDAPCGSGDTTPEEPPSTPTQPGTWDWQTFKPPPGFFMPSAQHWNRMIPSEQEGYQAMLEQTGAYWPDFLHWMQRRSWPQWYMPEKPQWGASWWR